MYVEGVDEFLDVGLFVYVFGEVYGDVGVLVDWCVWDVECSEDVVVEVVLVDE